MISWLIIINWLFAVVDSHEINKSSPCEPRLMVVVGQDPVHRGYMLKFSDGTSSPALWLAKASSCFRPIARYHFLINALLPKRDFYKNTPSQLQSQWWPNLSPLTMSSSSWNRSSWCATRAALPKVKAYLACSNSVELNGIKPFKSQQVSAGQSSETNLESSPGHVTGPHALPQLVVPRHASSIKRAQAIAGVTPLHWFQEVSQSPSVVSPSPRDSLGNLLKFIES